jgi:DNA-binding CsgD family transcriptional regulator
MARFVPVPRPSAAPEREIVRRDALLRAVRREQPDAVVLAGPGGSGKTTTARQIAPALGSNPLWIDAAQAANLGALLRQVAANAADPAAAKIAHDLIMSAPTPRDAAGALAAAATGFAPLVFEDVHAWPATTRETIALLAESTTIPCILTTRDVGSVDVGRIGARRRLRIFAFESLGFSANEIQTFARLQNQPVTPREAREIQLRTSGLPMGVALLLRSEVGTGGPFLLERYVRETLIPTLTEPEREVACLAGMLNGQVNVSAVEACLGAAGRRGVRRLVEDLSVAHVRNGALVVHDVFLSVLADLPSAFAERDVVLLLARALEERGHIAEALQISRAVEGDGALKILARHANWLIEHGFADVARETLQGIPVRVRRASAPLLGLEAQLLMRSGDLRRAAALLRQSSFPAGEREQVVAQLATLLSNQGSGEGRTILREAATHARASARAEILSALAVSEAVAGDGPACRQTLRRLDEAIDGVEDDLARVRIAQRRATALLYLGEFGHAEDAALEAIALAERGAFAVQLANAHSILYASRHLLDDLTGAADAARLMEEHALRAGDDQTAASAAVAQLLIATERGDFVGARRAEEAVERHGHAHGFRDRFAFGYARAMLDVIQRDAGRARRRLEALLRRSDLQPEERAICACLRACLNEPAEPLDGRRHDVDLAQRLVDESGAPHVLATRTQVFAYCFASIAERQVGRYRKAGQYALKAASSAGTSGQRVFAFATTLLAETGGDRAVRDCVRALAEGGLAGYAAFIDAVCHPSEAAGTPLLTQAEHAVLSSLAAGLSVKGIAAHRRTSVNTVRVQVQRLHRKFDCATNDELISRARHLGVY